MMNIQTKLPLTEPTFFILLVLASGPQHGYAIMKESKGRLLQVASKGGGNEKPTS